jgi:lysyl-tRNA synthetase class 2
MAMRNNGLFLDLMDATGKIQVFCHKESMTPEELAKLETFDMGDIIGAVGTIRRTPRGELSVRAGHIEMLTKCLRPLPEKYHGLADIEMRYRQRYVDLIVNEESRETLRKRSQIIAALREYLTNEWGGVEVETPMLHPILGGATAKPFTTHHNTLDSEFYLRIAPELYLKRLIVGGLADCVFEINRNFRNEGISPRHNPEFTMVELYKTYTDVNDIMDLTEGSVRYIAQKVFGKTQFQFGENTIDVGAAWPRKSMCALVADATGVDFMTITDAAAARGEAKKLNVHVEPTAKWGEVVAAVFEEKVEHTLIQPTHVTDFPLDISPLAKPHRSNPILTERTESFMNGWEIANMFTELNDPADQLARFEEQVKARDAGNEEAQMLDADYVTALEYGLPPTGGWGMGIDRLCMILTGSLNIRDVIAFPTLKPLK